jgi:hypothetical protein
MESNDSGVGARSSMSTPWVTSGRNSAGESLVRLGEASSVPHAPEMASRHCSNTCPAGSRAWCGQIVMLLLARTAVWCLTCSVTSEGGFASFPKGGETFAVVSGSADRALRVGLGDDQFHRSVRSQAVDQHRVTPRIQHVAEAGELGANQNALPSPRRRTARISGRSPRSSNTKRNADRAELFNAFNLSGRFSTTSATGPSTSNNTSPRGVAHAGHSLATRVSTSYVATDSLFWLTTSASQTTSP